MAINFPKFNFFNRLDARARIFFLVGAVVGIILIVYLGTRFFFGGAATTGPSRVAGAPALQSVPGGTGLSSEYQQSIEQANLQAAQQAQMSGTTAIPTQINTAGQVVTTTAACVVCTEDATNVKTLLDAWQSQGQITPEVASALQQLADKNVSPEEFAAALDDLVKQGKLTPEQARQLLDQYRKQHANRLVQDSAKMMDGMIKNGSLPIDVANRLLNAQRNNTPPANYAELLQDQVDQGKISPATAQQLLSQYTQQKAREVTLRSIASLKQMVRTGQLTPDVEVQLEALETRMVPLNTYAATLQQLLSQGKLIPATANKILQEYSDQKAEIGPTASIQQMLAAAEKAAFDEIKELVASGKMTAQIGDQLSKLIQANIPLDAYRGVINQLVQQGKITPAIAKQKIADYQAVKGLREMAQALGRLQANNASAADYLNALRNGVANGQLTPDQAAQLMQEYQAMLNRGVVPAGTPAAGTSAFEALRQRVQEGGAPTEVAITPDQFATAQVQATAETAADRQAKIDALVAAMSGQAQQLITAWEPPVMRHIAGTFDAEKRAAAAAAAAGAAGASQTTTTTVESTGPPLIKAGTILMAVLDTTANSDYPDNPVMATVVSGRFKGAKLLGKLVTTKNVAGQMDRITLNFSMMNMDEWDRSKSITAYAIDPDTAKANLATSVNYHWFQRFGLTMAFAFLQGYASAITNAGTSTTGIFGTSTTHDELDPRSKLLVGFGQVGQTLGNATQNWINRPPTVKVDSGVGIGILFMSDLS